MVTRAPPIVSKPVHLDFGGVNIEADSVFLVRASQDASALREAAAARKDRQKVRTYVIEDLSGGLGIKRGSEATDANRIKASDGPWTHLFGRAPLPPQLMQQSTLQAVNASTWRASNLSPVECVSALGGTLVKYTGTGPYLFREDTATGALSLAHTFTDMIMDVKELTVGNRTVFAVSTDGQTDGVKYTLDPTAGVIVWTVLFAYPRATDVIWAMASHPQLGAGYNGYYGTYNGVPAVWYSSYADAAPVTPQPVVGAINSGVYPNFQPVNTGFLAPGAVVEVDQGGGAIAWLNLSNSLVQDDTYAVADFSAAFNTTRWAVYNGFSQGSVPDNGVVEGVHVRLRYEHSATGNSSDRRYYVEIWNAANTKLGETFEVVDDSTSSNTDRFFYLGGPGSDFFAGLRGEDIPNIKVAFRYYGGDSLDFELDAVTVNFYWQDEAQARQYTAKKLPGDVRAEFAFGAQPWIGIGSVLADDGISARSIIANQGEDTDAILPYRFWTAGEVPALAFLEGLFAEIDRRANSAWDINLTWLLGRDSAGGVSLHHRNIALPNSLTQAYYGGSGNTWGFTNQYMGSDLHLLQLKYQAEAINSGLGNDIEIDYFMARAAYRLPGAQVGGPPSGTGGPGEGPAGKWIGQVENLDVTLEFPGDTQTIDTPRKLVTYAWDFDGFRPVVTEGTIPLTFPYVHATCFTQNALHIACGNEADAGRNWLVYDFGSGNFTDLQWSRDQGYTEAWGIVQMTAVGDDVVFEKKLDDNTVMQSGLYAAQLNAFSEYGPRETIAAPPLPMYRGGLASPASRARHRWYPVSTTHLAATHQYTPDSVWLDPISHLSDVPKQDGILWITLPDLDIFGPEEMDKSIITARCESRGLSADLRQILEYSLDGGTTWVDWASFTGYGQEISLPAPVAFTSLSLRVGIDRGAEVTETPSQLRIIIAGTADWTTANRKVWRVYLNEDWLNSSRRPRGIEGLWEDLGAVANTPQIMTINGNDTYLCTWGESQAQYKPFDRVSSPRREVRDGSGPYITLEQWSL